MRAPGRPCSLGSNTTAGERCTFVRPCSSPSMLHEVLATQGKKKKKHWNKTLGMYLVYLSPAPIGRPPFPTPPRERFSVSTGCVAWSSDQGKQHISMPPGDVCYRMHFHRVSFPLLAAHNNQDGSLDPDSRWACQFEARDFDFGIDWKCRIAYSLDEVRDLDAVRVGETPYGYSFAALFLGSSGEGIWCTLNSLTRGCECDTSGVRELRYVK